MRKEQPLEEQEVADEEVPTLWIRRTMSVARVKQAWGEAGREWFKLCHDDVLFKIVNSS